MNLACLQHKLPELRCGQRSAEKQKGTKRVWRINVVQAKPK